MGPGFWCRIAIGYVSSGPCSHLQAWLKPVKSGIAEDDARPELKICEFVCGECDVFLKEWQRLLEPAAIDKYWTPLMVRISLDQECSEEEWLVEAVMHSVEMLTDYYRRFMIPTGTYPLLLMWRIVKPPSVQCDLRLQCVTDLIGVPDDILKVECLTTWTAILQR